MYTKNFVIQSLMLIVVFICSFTECSAKEPGTYCNHKECTEYSQDVSQEKKIYVKASDLIIQDDGLYLVQAEDILPLTEVHADLNGLYVILSREPAYIGPKLDVCPNGHAIYDTRCGGCANWWCIYRCKCCSPW